MARRYELPDVAWELIADLVSPEQKMGRPRSDDRLMLNGIFWILCSGAAWRDLPERFGPWSTVYQGSSQKTEKIVRLASNGQVEAIDPDAVVSGNIKMNPNLTLLAGHG